MAGLQKLLVPAVVAALVVAAGLVFLRGEEQRTLTASFPRAISLYEGSEVRVLGVPVGEITSVTPTGTTVEVAMSIEEGVKVPADAQAVIVSPSVVGDRFVQLTPVYTGGPVLPDGARLGLERTSTPLELDEIYRSLDELTVALGPRGANREGALTRLLDSAARNWGGQGKAFHETVADLGKFTGTLENNKEELFGTARRLEAFVSTLARNDQTVRDFNQSLAQVSRMLAGERDELSASLRNLAIAMTEVSSFVRENRAMLGRNIRGLNRVTKTLVDQRDALDEILRVGPGALTNFQHVYNPQAGTHDTRANMGNLGHVLETDPALFFCTMVEQARPDSGACDIIKQALPRAGTFGDGASQYEVVDPTLGGLVGVAR